MSTVYVLNKDGKPLMPTTRCGHVRRLLKEQKAQVVTSKPFTIQLLYETDDVVQPLYLGIDPGRTNIGVAVVKTDGTAVFTAHLETRNKEIPKLMQERKGEDKGAKKGVSIDESDDGAEKKTKDRMIGRRSIIRYGLYHMSIQINSAMAQRNGVTMDDVNLLIDALQHMFEEDMSSSRALTLRKLFVVEHTKPMGNAYRDTIERALAARLKQPNDAPTSYEDYEVTYHREMLPDEVKVTEYNYNSQSV